MNTGHGHVYLRDDGIRMRCGGPLICRICALDAARKSKEEEELAKQKLQPTNLFSEEPLEEIYHIVSWADSKNGTRRNYSIRRRDGADPKDFATVYAERKNETCEWQWSCFRAWGRLTATVSICMAKEWQEARDGQKEAGL